MALVIRMRQQGAHNKQTFRLVVTDIRNPRDGKYVEMLGWYNPFAPNEKNAHIDVARLQYWLGMGATISVRAKTLVKRLAPELVQEMTAQKVARLEKDRAKRQEKQKQKKQKKK